MAHLITRNGQRTEMSCTIAEERHGKLFCDSTVLTPSDLQGDLMLETDDGRRCHIRITSIAADYVTFSGRLLE